MKRNVDRKTLEALARLSATGLSHGKGFVSWPCHAPLLQVVRRNVISSRLCSLGTFCNDKHDVVVQAVGSIAAFALCGFLR